MASVTFQNVHKRFGDFMVVEDLSIEVEDKEFVVFVRPSA
jgi:multiple sugar transport system ATP-binding protein